MKPTIKDVARESGFSTATVSLALSNKPNRISESTRKRIIEVAKRLNYRPNRVAVSLATRKSRMIGLVIPDVRNAHIADMYMSIDLEIQKHGYVLLCSTVSNNKVCSVEMISNLIDNGVEGIIFAQPEYINSSVEERAVLQQIRNSGLPVVSCDNIRAEIRGAGVRFDYFSGGYMATRHLIEYGHRRIGCITGTMDYRVTLDRLNGYRKALEEAGITYDPKLIYVGDYDLESGSNALPYLLGQKVTAIFAFNDQMAFGAYRSARNYGIKIPRDVSIIGFDDVMFSNVMEVPLTTIHMPTEEMGIAVARTMMSMLNDEKPPELKIITFEPNLMLRASTAKIMS